MTSKFSHPKNYFILLATAAVLGVPSLKALEIIDGDLQIQPDATATPPEAGTLSVAGPQINWGTTSGLLSAVTGDYQNTLTPTITWSAAEAGAIWRWFDNAGTAPRKKMQLNADNTFHLFESTGATAKIQFEPNGTTPFIKIGNERVLTTSNNGSVIPYLTQSQANSLYLPTSPSATTVSQNLSVGTRHYSPGLGARSLTVGENVSASGNNAVAFGSSTYAIGQSSFATGESSYAYGNNSIAMGSNAQAISTGDIALGTNASASGGNSVAIGEGSQATGYNSLALGAYAYATAEYSAAFNGGDAEGYRSVAFSGGNAYGSRSFAIGDSTDASGSASFAGGKMQRQMQTTASRLVMKPEPKPGHRPSSVI